MASLLSRLIAFLILLPTLAFVTPLVAQDYSKYFELKSEKYKEESGDYIGISPMVRLDATDPIGKFISAHRRRFAYILANRTKFQGLDEFYPDTAKINSLYIKNLEVDAAFNSYYASMIAPAKKNPSVATIPVTRRELMQVASKFFFCSAVKPDRSINPYICITLNGVREAVFDKDHTILEALCFEAIFEAIDAERPKRTAFVENFLRYVEEESARERPGNLDDSKYLINVRTAVFRRMETDKALEAMLREFLRKNADNSPMRLID